MRIQGKRDERWRIFSIKDNLIFKI